MLTYVSRFVGFVTVVGLAVYGGVCMTSKILTWREASLHQET